MSSKYEQIIHVQVRGRVQGVGYRAWTEREALRRGLDGWVRNRREGFVEAVFAGAADEVAAMAQSLADGPHGSVPAGISTRQGGVEDLAPAFGGGFVILPTV